MLKFTKGDKIIVRVGRDRGRTGVIEKVFPKKGTALVPGVNIYKKHVKKDLARDGKGGIYEIPRPIDVSKIAISDPKTNKKSRVSFKFEGKKKVRIASKSKTIIEVK